MTLMPEPGDEDRVALVEVTKALFAAAGAAGGFVIGGPFGAGLGAAAVQGTTSAIETLGSKWRRKAEDDAARALMIASETSGKLVVELAATLSEDVDLLLLGVSALQGASETALESKVRLLGQVIGNAATDRALADEGLLITRAVRLLEAPHVRVLALLSNPPKYEGDPSGRSTATWSPAMLGAHTVWPSSSITAVLMTLQSASCAVLTSARIDGGTAATYRDLMTMRQPVALEDMNCEITDFGSRVLNGLTDAGQSDG